jgi:hypothetical protein
MANHPHERERRDDDADAPRDDTALTDAECVELERELMRDVHDVRKAPVRTTETGVDGRYDRVCSTTGLRNERMDGPRCQDGTVLGPVRKEICREIRGTPDHLEIQ